MMPTVVLVPAQAFALGQLRFNAVAVDIVQVNWTCTVAKVGVGVSIDGNTTACLLANNPGIVEIPVIITHRPPHTVVVDLHSALAGSLPIHQTDGAIY